jgi:hypothetical protein
VHNLLTLDTEIKDPCIELETLHQGQKKCANHESSSWEKV